MLEENTETYPNANGVWRNLRRRDSIILTLLHQIRAIRKPQPCLYLKREYGLLARLEENYRLGGFWVHFIGNGEPRERGTSHYKLLHKFVEDGPRYKVGLWVRKPGTKKYIILTNKRSRASLRHHIMQVLKPSVESLVESGTPSYLVDGGMSVSRRAEPSLEL